MALKRMSAWSADNKAPYEARNYRMSLEIPAGFNPGEYVPVVVYNAFVGSGGKGMRSLAQKTHARLFPDHAILDEFDPAIDLSSTPDGYPLFELACYLIDLSGEEHLYFTVKLEPVKPKGKKLYPSAEFPLGSRPTIRIYRDRPTPESVGRVVAEVKGLITEKGLDFPAEALQFCVSPVTGQHLGVKGLTVMLVGADGVERYAFAFDVNPGGPPPLSALLSAPDSIH